MCQICLAMWACTPLEYAVIDLDGAETQLSMGSKLMERV